MIQLGPQFLLHDRKYRQDILFIFYGILLNQQLSSPVANVFTCKRFEFVLQVEGLLANSP